MPDFRSFVREHLPVLAVSPEHEAEIVEELALEVEARYERALRSGLGPEEALREAGQDEEHWVGVGAALRATLAKSGEIVEPPGVESSRSARFEGLWQDVRYAVRQLRRSPGYADVVVMLLAMGVGANTAIFSLLHAVLLRSLPVKSPGELVFVGRAEAEGSTNFLPSGSVQVFSKPFFREFGRQQEVFSEIAAIQSFPVLTYGRVAGREVEKLQVELVSGSYFATLGIGAVRGRVLADGDDQAGGGHPVAVARYGAWRERFGADPGIVGKAVQVGKTAYTIVGVAAPEFFGVTVGRAPDLWIPLAMAREMSVGNEKGSDDRMHQSLHLIGRLRKGVSSESAETNTTLLFRQIMGDFVGSQPSAEEATKIQRARVELIPAARGRSNLRSDFGMPLKILMGVVALVLLITCANIANLLLARSAGRQREFAVRMSLGAESGRLVRQLMVESGLVGLLGSAAGVALAWAVSPMLPALLSTDGESVPLRSTPEGGVLAFAALVSLATVFLFGLAPALRVTRVNLAAIVAAKKTTLEGAGSFGLTRVLVVGQVALSVVLVAGAGLFLQSFVNLTREKTGFDKRNVLRIQVDPEAAGHGPGAPLTAMMRRIEEKVNGLPGVQAASFALSVFDGGGWSQDDIVVRGGAGPERSVRVVLNVVGRRYFDVLKTPVLLGRGFEAGDQTGHRGVAVINETMARTHFGVGGAGGQASPLGRIFGVGDDTGWQDIEVVGVVKDARYMELEEAQLPAVFFPYSQHDDGVRRNLVVRYSGDAGSMARAILQALREVEPNLPAGDVRTLAELVDGFTVNRRVVAQVSGAFGTLAALLACIGIYGVLSYGVSQRTNEFGIRAALGASPRAVLGLVLTEALWMTGVGAVFGVGLALAAGRLASGFLFGVKADDPVEIGVAVVVLVAVGVAGGCWPAVRAMRLDPWVALREE